MCGINGIYSKNNRFEIKKTLERMNLLLRHRGPDFQSVYEDKSINFGFGSTRLSIIDLNNRSNQPFISKRNSNIIVFNGEIYNFKKIKDILISKGIHFTTQSDTEVIIEGYNYFGKDILNYLEGMFSFVIWDNKKKIFFCARDHIGIKPFIYFVDKNLFIFSSEIKPIIENFSELKKINIKSILNILNYGSINQPNTIYKNLNYLPPGNYMEIDIDLKIKVVQYWNINNFFQNKKKFRDSEDYSNQTAEFIKKNMENQLVSDVPISNLLSGGLDSSVVLGISSQKNKEIINYNLYFDEGSHFDERHEAKTIAKYLGQEIFTKSYNDKEIIDLIDKYCDIIDQPSFDGFNSFLILSFTKNKTKICLSGLGADEIFFGYGIHLNFLKSRKLKDKKISKILSLIYKLRPSNFLLNYHFSQMSVKEYLLKLRKLTKNDEANVFNKNFHEIAEINKKEILDLYDNNIEDLKKRIFHFELKNYLNNTLLRDTDIVSMINSIELRPLFLNHKIVEWAAMTTEYLDLNFKNTKLPLRTLYKNIFKAAYQEKKRGFELPHFKWISNKFLKEKILYYLSTEQIYSKFYRDLLVKNISNKKFAKEIFNYYLLKLWLEKQKIKI